MVVVMLAVMFFPGVAVHELSHLLMAGVLFVPVHDIEFLPELHGKSVKLGSVQISQPDFIRRFLIGVAPVLVGGALLGILVWYAGEDFSWRVMFSAREPFLKHALIIWGIFMIANTMFSSKKDLEGALELGLLLSILSGGVFFVQPSLFLAVGGILNSEPMLRTALSIDLILAIPLLLNLFIVGALRIFVKRQISGEVAARRLSGQ